MAKATIKIGRYVWGAIAFLSGTSAVNADLLSEGRQAYLNYDFELASEKYEKYSNILKKSPNASGKELLDQYLRQLEIAENSLDNVQKIEIIDRIDVPASDYLKYLKLPATGGKLLSKEVSLLKNRQNMSDFAYSSESGDLMMWSENDADQKEVIVQSERLMDGSWEKPVKIGDAIRESGNARNPFLLTDGLTLYFSGNGDESMGGYDLFVATKDPVSGEFRQPIALGYPFNSPFNEYLMAIDEDNGIGWWVTDRNRLEGQLTIYIFKTNDVRKNYVLEEEDDIIALARIDDISVTQNPETDYARILKDIDRCYNQNDKAYDSEFIFPMPGGKVIKNISDFKSSAAKRNMQQYLQAVDEFQSLQKKLSSLRRQYHKTDKKKSSASALRNQILDLEKGMEVQKDKMKKMRNTIISSEINN